jgi:hypothetical protein
VHGEDELHGAAVDAALLHVVDGEGPAQQHARLGPPTCTARKWPGRVSSGDAGRDDGHGLVGADLLDDSTSPGDLQRHQARPRPASPGGADAQVVLLQRQHADVAAHQRLDALHAGGRALHGRDARDAAGDGGGADLVAVLRVPDAERRVEDRGRPRPARISGTTSSPSPCECLPTTVASTPLRRSTSAVPLGGEHLEARGRPAA